MDNYVKVRKVFKSSDKKRHNLFVIVALLLTMLAGSFMLVNADNVIPVKVNGKQLTFDVQPVIVNSRTLVPLRAIFEELEAKVSWDETTQTVLAIKGETFIMLQINNGNAFVNNKQYDLDVPAQLVQSRTMVPIRFIAESLGAKVDWIEETSTVEISY